MTALVVLPIVIPVATAALGFMAYRSAWLQRWIAMAGATALLGAALALLIGVRDHGVQAVQMGNWAAPFGISLVADMFSAIMIVLNGLMGFAIVAYSMAEVDERRQHYGFFPLLHVLLMGVSGAFLTGDIFNLYVWFEVMLMSSFVLLALGGERRQLEGAIKYVTLNLISSIVFLTAVGLLYATAHTLNMADLHGKVKAIYAVQPELITAIAALFAVSFGIKAAVFPLFFWLPASYHTPPASVSAIFGLLTKVGVYSLVRVFTLVFDDLDVIYNIVLVIAALTMVIGVLGAIAQYEFRRILSIHIISQIGYLIMGLGLLASDNIEAQTLGLAATVFYTAHVVIVKGNLFLISGTVNQMRGTYQLKKLGGLVLSAPWLAILFLLSAMSLAGMPPMSGFWAKLSMIKAGLLAEAWWVVFAALLAGIMTLMSMIKIWNEAFWKKPPVAAAASNDDPDHQPMPPLSRGRMFGLIAPIILLTGVTVYLGLNPQSLMTLSQEASRQMLNPQEHYIPAVNPLTLEEAFTIDKAAGAEHGGEVH